MDICGNCGAEASGRFCSDCGALLTSERGDAPVVLDAGLSIGVDQPDSVRSGSPRRTALTVVALAAVVALGVFLLIRSPDTEVAEPVEESDDAPAVTVIPVPRTQPTTTSGSGATTQEAPPTTTSEYWLGEEAGLYAFVRDASGLLRIDMDTGEQQVMNADISPLIFTGEYLVATDRSQRLYAFTLEALGKPFDADPVPISEHTYRPRSRISISSDRSLIWLTHIEYAASSVEVSLQSGEETRRSVYSASGLYLRDAVSPRFFSPFSGGIYEVTSDGGFERYADGFVVAEGFGRILIQECDEALVCENRWFDTETLDPLVDLIAPKDVVFGRGQFFGRGRAVPEANGNVLDIVSGQRLALRGDEFNSLFSSSVFELSEDLRFVAAVDGGAAHIRSFGTQTSQKIPYLATLGAGIVFVPKSATEGAPLR